MKYVIVVISPTRGRSKWHLCWKMVGSASYSSIAVFNSVLYAESVLATMLHVDPLPDPEPAKATPTPKPRRRK